MDGKTLRIVYRPGMNPETLVAAQQKPTSLVAHGRDQQIAANGLSTPHDVIAILLHRLVRPLY